MNNHTYSLNGKFHSQKREKECNDVCFQRIEMQERRKRACLKKKEKKDEVDEFEQRDILTLCGGK